MSIYPTNKIPQYAVVSSLEGALQPDADDKKHRDLVINQKFASMVNQHNVEKGKSEEQIQADIELMKTASPSLRLLDDQLSIKKASPNSEKAIADSLGNKSVNDNLRSMHSSSVRPVREEEKEFSGNSKFASTIAGGTSMFAGKKLSDNTELIDQLQDISEISRTANRKKRQALASYHERSKRTSEQVAEEQKARKLGAIDPITGTYTAAFSSSNQAQASQEETLENLFEVFKNKIPNLDNSFPSRQAALAKEIGKYQTAKVVAQFKDYKTDWKSAAVADIQSRVTTASKKAEALVTEANKQRQAEKKVVSYDDLATVMHTKKEVYDLKSDNIKMASKKTASIKAERNLRSSEVGPSGVSRPSVNIATAAAKTVADSNIDKKAERMQEL